MGFQNILLLIFFSYFNNKNTGLTRMYIYIIIAPIQPVLLKTHLILKILQFDMVSSTFPLHREVEYDVPNVPNK